MKIWNASMKKLSLERSQSFLVYSSCEKNVDKISFVGIGDLKGEITLDTFIIHRTKAHVSCLQRGARAYSSSYDFSFQSKMMWCRKWLCRVIQVYIHTHNQCTWICFCVIKLKLLGNHDLVYYSLISQIRNMSGLCQAFGCFLSITCVEYILSSWELDEGSVQTFSLDLFSLTGSEIWCI